MARPGPASEPQGEAGAGVPDAAWVAFLQWALPHLRLRWPGFRKVRRQVIHRIRRRMAALGLADPAAYRAHLEAHPEEWSLLDGLCRVTVSRFWRDKGVWDRLGREALPVLARRVRDAGGTAVTAWSAGCGSGEEPYSLGILWRQAIAPAVPGVALSVLATDADPILLARAAKGVYPASALKELPAPWRAAAFTPEREALRLLDAYRAGIAFRVHDLRVGPPDGPFHLVLCRNLAFTYFDAELQREVAATLCDALVPGGLLVVGAHERLPPGAPLSPWDLRAGIYRRR